MRKKTLEVSFIGGATGKTSDVKNLQEMLALILFSGGVLAMVQS